MMPPDTEAFVRLGFAAQLPLRAFDTRLDRIEPGAVTLSAPVLETMTTQGTGMVMGGVLGLLADVAAGLSIIAALETPRPVTTTGMNLVLLAPAQGERVIAEGRVLKAGKRIAAAACDVFVEKNGARNMVASLQASFAVSA